ncbi:MAG TPA: hypothetical protein VGQ62_05340 [Chloroflexota bacterium]|nr:hypothetical protein [Chloroflexota bacterium]
MLVHEQWGWPLPRPALDRVVERFSSRLLVVDRVDSADFGFRRLDYAQVAEVVSLSKTLGLLGGGLARRVSGYTPFHSTTETAGTRHALERLASGSTSEPYREFFKNSSQAIHPAVSTWAATHSIMASLEDERMLRQRNVRLVQASPLANGWPGWMDAAMSRGAGPGLAPVLRGCEPDTWTKVMRLLAERFETASTVGVFNWTGDPLAPAYEACLLIPVHGEMQHVAEVVRSVVALLEL